MSIYRHDEVEAEALGPTTFVTPWVQHASFAPFNECTIWRRAQDTESDSRINIRI